MEPEKVDPGFVKDFHSRGAAILAISLIKDHKNCGFTYYDILEYPGFRSLFAESWANASREQLMIKLKNMVRDLRDSQRSLHEDWMDARNSFLSRKRI